MSNRALQLQNVDSGHAHEPWSVSRNRIETSDVFTYILLYRSTLQLH